MFYPWIAHMTVQETTQFGHPRRDLFRHQPRNMRSGKVPSRSIERQNFCHTGGQHGDNS